jgi:hypothetical protein
MIQEDKITQGWWLDALELVLVLLGVNALDWCWLQRLLGSLLRVAYRNYAHM